MISIILAVYNGERYLKRCLNCLYKQTNNNFELVLINDGSVDSSLEIAKSYIGRLQNYKILSLDVNKGVANARNIGLSAAKGEYITFVDCDDWIDENAVDKMYMALSDLPEAVVFDYFKNDSSEKKSCALSCLNQTEALCCILMDHKVGGYLWNKIYLKQIIIDNKLRFHSSLRFGEDFNFNVRYMLCCESMVKCDEAYYHYFDNPQSLTRIGNYTHEKVSFLKGIDEVILMMQKKYIPANIINKYKSYYANVVLSLIANGMYSGAITTEERHILKKSLFKYHIKDILSTKLKISLLICRCSTNVFYCIWRTARWLNIQL